MQTRTCLLAAFFCTTFAATAVLAQEHPQLSPNEAFNSAAPGQADADIATCTEEAQGALQQSEKPHSTARKGLRGAAIAVVTHRPPAEGAAIGGGVGLLRKKHQSAKKESNYKEHVESCLAAKGYSVSGWK